MPRTNNYFLITKANESNNNLMIKMLSTKNFLTRAIGNVKLEIK